MTTMKRNLLTLTMPTFQGCSCHRKTKIKVLVVLYLTLLVHSTSGQQGFKPDGADEEETNWDRFDKEYGIAPKRDDVTGNPRGKAGKSGIVISDEEYLSENFTLSPGNRDSGIEVCCNFLALLCKLYGGLIWVTFRPSVSLSLDNNSYLGKYYSHDSENLPQYRALIGAYIGKIPTTLSEVYFYFTSKLGSSYLGK